MENRDTLGVWSEPGERWVSGCGSDLPDKYYFFTNIGLL